MAKKFDISLLPPSPDFSFEIDIWADGIRWVAGIDEVGRGALAGPVVASALIFPPDACLLSELRGVHDSKQMTPTQRELWAVQITRVAFTFAVGFASPVEIDEIGIVPATQLAMLRAIKLLRVEPEYLLVDYLELPNCEIPQKQLIKGDARSLSIASASILAKTVRDQYMRYLDNIFPDYGFAANKGYGTFKHREALARLGYCSLHRKTFKGVQEMKL